MDGPITKKAQEQLAISIPGPSLNLSTMQTELRPLEGNDVAGMLRPLLAAISELEAEVAWLKARA
jgi:hypothetical protein